MLSIILATSVVVVPHVIPGQALDAVRLGSPATQLGIKATSGTVKAGRLTVSLNAGKVHAVSMEIARGTAIKVGSTAISAHSVQDVARHVDGCGPVQFGNSERVQCDSGLVITGNKHLRLQVIPAALSSTGPKCDDYLEPGRSGSGFDVQAGKTYCLPGQMVGAQTRLSDVEATGCVVKRNRGATVVTCNARGTRFVFAGPDQRLSRVGSVPFQP